MYVGAHAQLAPVAVKLASPATSHPHHGHPGGLVQVRDIPQARLMSPTALGLLGLVPTFGYSLEVTRHGVSFHGGGQLFLPSG
jgi:hypothetical protein